MTELIARLKQRKLVQWAIAYVAFAFALIQVLDVVADSYDWPHSAMHVVVVAVRAVGIAVGDITGCQSNQPGCSGAEAGERHSGFRRRRDFIPATRCAGHAHSRQISRGAAFAE